MSLPVVSLPADPLGPVEMPHQSRTGVPAGRGEAQGTPPERVAVGRGGHGEGESGVGFLQKCKAVPQHSCLLLTLLHFPDPIVCP